MKTIRFVRTAAALFAAFVIATSLYAQTASTGAITGTVSDSSGAIIPGATVVATNTATAQQRTATTGANGAYNFALLPPGVYNLKFSATGFKVTEVPGLTVAVTETPVMNQKLELGAQTEQVTVEANAETIQTTSAVLGAVLAGSQIASLPLSSRNYTNIMALDAGSAAAVPNASLIGKGGMDYAVNGAPSGANNIQIDGVNVSPMTYTGTNTDTYNTYGTKPVPSPDSLQEFKVQASAYDASYGRNSGANINVVTKSGTNEFHGTLFEFFRNTVLNANDFFLNRGGKGKGVLNQNQFGGVVGGPIRKDKFFFFVSYQGTAQKNGVDSHGNAAETLPPIPGGDRSNTAAFQAAMGALNCPANHPTSAYNTLRGGVQVACDGSNINQVSMNLLQAKLPNGSYLLPASPTGGFLATNFSIPATYREDQGIANADYIISSKHTLALRFLTSYAPTSLSFPSSTLVPGFGDAALYNDNVAQVKLTSVLTSSLVNEVRLSFHRDVADFHPVDTFSDHQFGIQPVSPYQDYNDPGFMSSINITGAYQVGSNGNSTNSNTSTDAYDLADEISWTHGKHTIRTGFEVEQDRWNWNLIGLGQANIAISTFADFLLGLPGCAPAALTAGTCSAANPGLTNGTAFSNIASTQAADGLSAAGDPHSWRIKNNSAFVQDDIKLTSRLTINLGVRYQYAGFSSELYGTQTNLWQSAILSVPIPGNTPATGTLAGWVEPANYKGPILPGLTLSPTNSSLQSGPPKDIFSPRIGFAWQPLGGNKLVVRGGYGIFTDSPPGGDYVNAMNLSPPLAPPADKAGVANYYSTFAVPFGPTANTFPARWVDFSALTSSAFSQYSYGPAWQTPFVQSYNLGIQYSFLPSWVLEIGYVGSHGTHQPGTANFATATVASPANPVWGLTTDTVSNALVRVPYLGFSQINDLGTFFDSKYNSLQVTVRKQFSHGFQSQVAYTWSKSFSDSYQPSYGTSSLVMQYGGDTARPQRLTINYGWNLPFRNPRNAVLNRLVTGWNLSGVTTIQSGTFLTISDGRGGTIWNLTTSRAQLAAGKTYADIGTLGSITQRLGGASGGCGYFTSASVTGSVNGSSCASLSPFVIVPNAVVGGVVTATTGQGNLGQGVIEGPGQFNFDASLSKITRVGGIHENATVQFRAEFFNMMNHPQFSNPALTDSSATFGQITSTTVNPRLIQLALKYVF